MKLEIFTSSSRDYSNVHINSVIDIISEMIFLSMYLLYIPNWSTGILFI
jgi:hypothetical protein